MSSDLNNETRREWHALTRIAFRFVFLYYLLFSAAAILQLVPIGGGALGFTLIQAEQPLIVRIAKAAMDIDITVFPNGSGDTTYNYMQIAVYFAAALIGTLAWSALDRRRRSYPWLKEFLWIAMRFVLASAMLGYGINKVFGLQFPAPGMTRLLQNYGDSSPMGILWTFMGTSGPYTMFAGWMETIGGLLLLFRRTTLAGAVWTGGVMANVVVLNFCYDVPVKIYSSHLLLTAVLIAGPDIGRLMRMFFLNRPVEPKDLVGPWTKPWLRWSAFGVKLLWVIVVVPIQFWSNYQGLSLYGPLAPKGALDGTWEVAELKRDGIDLPPLTTDASRWRYLTLVDRPNWKMANLTKMRGPNDRWMLAFLDGTGAPAETSAERGKLSLTEQTAAAGDPSKAKPVVILDYERTADGRLHVNGEIAGVRFEAVCVKLEPGDYLLLNRGFHWINEYPFNR